MKTKILLCLILVVSAVSVAHGQSVSKNTIRIGVGTKWPNSLGEGAALQGGFAFSNEYLRELKRHLLVGANLHYWTQHTGFKNAIKYSGPFVVPNYLKDTKMHHESVVAGFVNVLAAPLNDSKNLFLLGGGIGIKYTSSTEYWAYKPDQYFVASQRNTGLSFNAVIGYDYKLNQHLNLGIRQNLIIDGDVIPLLTVGVGGRF